MELEIIAIYCWCELILNQLNVKNDRRTEMNNAEVLTTAIVAVRFFSGNFQNACNFLRDHGYVLKMLSKSRFNRRLHKLGSELIGDVQKIIGEIFKSSNEGATIYGDKAYTDYDEEDLLAELKIDLKPQRKENSKRQHSGCMNYLIDCKRKMVETAFSGIAKLFPKHIHAVTAKGFELKVALFTCIPSFMVLTEAILA